MYRVAAIATARFYILDQVAFIFLQPSNYYAKFTPASIGPASKSNEEAGTEKSEYLMAN